MTFKLELPVELAIYLVVYKSLLERALVGAKLELVLVHLET